MRNLFKCLFKKQNVIVVYKNDKPKKFKSFSKAMTFMMLG